MKKEKIKDVGAGLVAMSMDTFKDMDFGRGYTMEAWTKMQATTKGLRIGMLEVPVKYHKKSGFLRGLKMFFEVELFIIIQGLRYRVWNNDTWFHYLEMVKEGRWK